MKIKKRSLLSGRTHEREIDISPEQMERWQAGGLIQDVCPHLSKEEREFLISGSTQEEWDSLLRQKRIIR